MNCKQSARFSLRWARISLVVFAASLVVSGCKTSVIQPPSSGVPSPPSGGMPSPPSGGSSGGGSQGGEQSGGQQGGGSSGGGSQGGGSQGGGSQGGGSQGGGSEGGGSQGGGSSGGGASPTGGSSGGPWMQPFDEGNGTIMSVNSWGYTTSPGMGGPPLGAEAQCAFGVAQGAATPLADRGIVASC